MKSLYPSLYLSLLILSIQLHTNHGLASPTQKLLGKRGSVDSLKDWGASNGVTFSNGVDVVDSGDDNWQISCSDDEGQLEKGSVLLSVPNELILSSAAIVKEMGKDNLSKALQTLGAGGFGDQVGEFLIFVKILKEVDQGSSSDWNAWIQCLPREFSTGVCFTPEELDCLPSFSRQLADFEVKKLAAFSHCADLVRGCWESKGTFTNQKRKTLYQWAYNVVYTRCWKFSDDLESGTTDMVPIGDLFNHKEPANVAVDSTSGTSIDFILQTDGVDLPDLTLSYGGTNPHRFLTIFGFVDETMPQVFSQIVFPEPTNEHVALGCNDRSKMVYAAEDGAISGVVWDVVLYALLASQPVEQMDFYEAHMTDNEDAKKALYAKYLLETSLTLKNHVDGTLKELEEKQQAIEKVEGRQSNLALIKKQNQFLQAVFRKVQARLNEMVQTETIRRRSAASSASS